VRRKLNMQALSFFEGIDANVVREIDNASSVKTYRAGDTIFEKGSTAENLYILEQGEIHLLMKAKDDTRFNLDRPGEVFGWSSLVENGVYTSTATAKADTSVRCIPKSDIDPIFDKNTGAAVHLYRKLGDVFSKRMSKVVD
jgi:CRP-like cAMP-binding protein